MLVIQFFFIWRKWKVNSKFDHHSKITREVNVAALFWPFNNWDFQLDIELAGFFWDKID